jgi:hypothetical protein
MQVEPLFPSVAARHVRSAVPHCIARLSGGSFQPHDGLGRRMVIRLLDDTPRSGPAISAIGQTHAFAAPCNGRWLEPKGIRQGQQPSVVAPGERGGNARARVQAGGAARRVRKSGSNGAAGMPPAALRGVRSPCRGPQGKWGAHERAREAGAKVDIKRVPDLVPERPQAPLQARSGRADLECRDLAGYDAIIVGAGTPISRSGRGGRGCASRAVRYLEIGRRGSPPPTRKSATGDPQEIGRRSGRPLLLFARARRQCLQKPDFLSSGV